MSLRASFRLVFDQRGTALPMAMLALLILSVLVIGFSVLSSSEPTIANNQLRVAQARALAEAGVERAIWALNEGMTNPACSPAPPAFTTACPDSTHAIPVTFVTAPAEYNNGPLVTLATGGNAVGGFRVTVTNGATNYERKIEAVGWVPNDTTTGPKTHQKITVTVFNPRFVMPDPPAALSVRGELQMGGNSLVDSRLDTSCGRKMGTVTAGPTTLQGSATDIWGAAGSSSDPNLAIHNQVTDAGGGALPTTGGDVVQNVATSLPSGTPGAAFDSFILSDAAIDVLRAYAKAHGTYLQGSVSFNSSNQLPNGLVFVDTVNGTNITQEDVTPPTPPSNFASVDINGNAGIGGAFNGWLFVNGSLTFRGNFKMNGFAYAQNDIAYHGTGTGQLNGAMVSRNIRDTSSTSIDSDLLGNAAIVYNCQAARTGGGAVSSRWSLKSGTYKEVSGS
jgi:hypothetical protein